MTLETSYFEEYLKSVKDKGDKLFKLWFCAINIALIFSCFWFFTVIIVSYKTKNMASTYYIDFGLALYLPFYLYIGSVIKNIKQYLKITSKSYEVISEFCKENNLYDFYLKEYQLYNQAKYFKPLSKSRIIYLQVFRYMPFVVLVIMIFIQFKLGIIG